MVNLLPHDLVALLELRAHEAPHRQAFRYIGGTQGPMTLTYLQLREVANVVAHALEAGSERGERVLLLYPPGLEFIQAFLGTVSAGAIAVPAPPPNPLKPKQSLQRLASIVASARPTRALTLSGTLAALRPAISELSQFDAITWIATDALPDPPEGYRPRGVADSKDVALIQYTSGSTSEPKGAALTHGNVMHNLRYFDDGWDHSPDSVSVNWLPAFHDLGLIYGILAPIWGGFQSLQMSPIDVIQRPLTWLRTISDHRATHSCGPNFIYELCVRKVGPSDVKGLDLRSWRMALTAAEPVRADTMRRFSDHFAPAGFNPRSFCPGYGLSEGTCKVVAVPWHDRPTVLSVAAEALERHAVEMAPEGGPGTIEVVGCGRPSFGVGVAVVDPDTRQTRGPGAVGELWVSGPSIASSYWEAPEATSRELRARLAGRADTPFLRTGDLGFVNDGEVFITGRIKDMIIVRGANHYPQDIEYSVQDAHAAVRAGCTAAFALDDGGDEELAVVAEVDLRGRNGDGPVTASAVTTAIIKAVAEGHGLRVARVALIPPGSIPKTTSGKIKRRATRQALIEGQLELICDERRPSSKPAAARRDHIRARLTDIVSEIGDIPFERLHPEESLHGLGIDSLAGVNIAYEIGLLTGKDVPSALLDERDTIEKLVDYVVGTGGAR